MTDFEKLGVFYLGRVQIPMRGKPRKSHCSMTRRI